MHTGLRRIVAILATVLLEGMNGSISAASPASAGPLARVDEPAHDFGEITQGAVVRHTFVLQNAGTADLTIARVQPTCGCTAAAPTRTVLAPGESTGIEVAYNSANQKGPQHKRIGVFTNDPRAPELTLTLTAIVIAELDASPDRVFIKGMSPGETRREKVTIRNAGRRDLVIQNVRSDTPGIAVALERGAPFQFPLPLARGKALTLEVSVTYPVETPYSFLHGEVALTLAEPSPRPFEIGVTAVLKSAEADR
jgi:hypothetical protein